MGKIRATLVAAAPASGVKPEHQTAGKLASAIIQWTVHWSKRSCISMDYDGHWTGHSGIMEVRTEIQKYITSIKQSKSSMGWEYDCNDQ